MAVGADVDLSCARSTRIAYSYRIVAVALRRTRSLPNLRQLINRIAAVVLRDPIQIIGLAGSVPGGIVQVPGSIQGLAPRLARNTQQSRNRIVAAHLGARARFSNSARLGVRPFQRLNLAQFLLVLSFYRADLIC